MPLSSSKQRRNTVYDLTALRIHHDDFRIRFAEGSRSATLAERGKWGTYLYQSPNYSERSKTQILKWSSFGSGVEEGV